MPKLPDGRAVEYLKVNELRKELERRGLSRSGSKKDLSARLSGDIHATKSDEKPVTPQNKTSLCPSDSVNNLNTENDDAVELDTIESDDDAAAADTSTGTVIFVPKEKRHPRLTPTSAELAVSTDRSIKTDAPVDPFTILHTDGEVVTSKSQNKTETTTIDVQRSPSTLGNEDTSQGPLSPRSTSSVGSRTSGGEAHSRRRKLWGTRSGVSSSQKTGTPESSIISFSTDTLEKMVPTLSVSNRKSSGGFPPTTSIDNAASDPITMPDTATVPVSRSLQSPSKQSLEHTDKSSNGTAIETATVAPQAIVVGAVDEEVEFMDATIEGGLDVIDVGESEKPLPKYADREQPDARQQDTRLVTRKRTNETEISADNDVKPLPVKRKGLKETKAVGYLVDEPERVEPCQSTTNKSTDFVYIRCLVRPFTANQLKQMITSAYGRVVDLWLDRIKSTSVVQLESKSAAVSCREGLDGSRWPSINPRVLRCDFVTDEFFNWMKQYGDEAKMQPPKHLLSGDTVPTTSLPVDKERKASNDRGSGNGKTESHSRKSDDLRQKLSRRDGVDSFPGVRTKPATVEDISGPGEARPEPAKMLDDLFRKTTTAPCIYWLSLTEEEAKIRVSEQADLAAKRGATRATRSPFAGASEADQLAPAAIDRRSADHDRKKPDSGSTNASVSAMPRTDTSVGSRVSPPKKTVSSGKQADGRGSSDRQERRRAGSPFMPTEKKTESTGKTTQKPANVVSRDILPNSRRQRSSSSSPSPSRLSKRPRGQQENGQRRKPIVDDYSRRRSSRSRSRSGGARYRSRVDSSTAGAYRRPRGSSPHTHRSRR